MTPEQYDSWMKARVTHGAYIGGKECSEHAIWRGMLARCHRPTSKGFYLYGALGITVCTRWRRSYEAFIADMGARPSAQHSIERKNNERGYMPSNCEWATPTKQSRNKRSNRWFSHAGRTMILSDWASELNISKQLAMYRWNNWGTFERGKTWQPKSQR